MITKTPKKYLVQSPHNGPNPRTIVNHIHKSENENKRLSEWPMIEA